MLKRFKIWRAKRAWESAVNMMDSYMVREAIEHDPKWKAEFGRLVEYYFLESQKRYGKLREVRGW